MFGFLGLSQVVLHLMPVVALQTFLTTLHLFHLSEAQFLWPLPLILLLSADVLHLFDPPLLFQGLNTFNLLSFFLIFHFIHPVLSVIISLSHPPPPVLLLLLVFLNNGSIIFLYPLNNSNCTQRSWTLVLRGHGPLRLSCFYVLTNLNQKIQSLQPVENSCRHLLTTHPSKPSGPEDHGSLN